MYREQRSTRVQGSTVHLFSWDWGSPEVGGLEEEGGLNLEDFHSGDLQKRNQSHTGGKETMRVVTSAAQGKFSIYLG